MSNAQFKKGFNAGHTKGLNAGVKIGEATTQMELGMKALSLAVAIRQAQKIDSVSQYVLLEILIDFLSSQTGGRIDIYNEAE